MNTKKFLMATGASFAVMFLLGGLFHMVIAKDFLLAHVGMAGNVGRQEPMMQYIAFGVLCLAAVMAYLYPKGVEGDNHLVQGFKFGMIIGFLWITPFAIIMYGSTMVFSGTTVATFTVWHIIEQGIGGMIIAMIYGKSPKG